MTEGVADTKAGWKWDTNLSPRREEGAKDTQGVRG